MLVLAAVVPLAHANTYVSRFRSHLRYLIHFLSKVTNPVASTTLPAGQQATIKWMDDGNSPSLAQLGPCFIGLYAGSVNEQVYFSVTFLVVLVLTSSHRLFCKSYLPALMFPKVVAYLSHHKLTWVPTSTPSVSCIPARRARWLTLLVSFIKFTSIGLANPSEPGFNYEAFSAHFT